MPVFKKHKETERLLELEENIVDKLPISESGKNKALIFLDIFVNIIIIAALVFIVRKFLFSPFQVFGPSMCDTLNYFREDCHRGFGEYLIVNKATYQEFFGYSLGNPKRGDIVVFHPPIETDDFYIKRIIGLPGETVEIKGGKLFIYSEEHPNGLSLDESYLNEENINKTSTFSSRASRKYEVPEGKYFVMGDNRKESTDSRSCFKAPFTSGCEGEAFFLEKDRIEGKAWAVLWPFSRIRFIASPQY